MKNGTRARAVVLLQTCEIFNSLTEAAAAVHLADPSSICRCCYGERTTAGGVVWRFADEIMQKAACEGKTLRQVCDEELLNIAHKVLYAQARSGARKNA